MTLPTQQEINASIQEYKSKLSNIALPDIDMAMHPQQVYFADDIRDKELFNDRFIESRVHEGMGAFAIYLMMGMQNALLIALIYGFFFMEGANITPIIIIGGIFGYLIILTPLYLTSKTYHPTPVRFNRQAQCVHIFWDKKTAITFPWKQGIPFSTVGQTSSGRHSLVFLFPIPKNADLNDEGILKVLEVPGAFDGIDQISMETNLDRLEFIRLYMEKGLGAIQPNKESIEAGGVNKPSGHGTALTIKRHGLIAIIPIVLGKIGYVIATGWLVDKWVEKRARSYEWPEDVQRLCAEGADVSKLDTTVITPRDDLFYGYVNGEFNYLDRNGRIVN